MSSDGSDVDDFVVSDGSDASFDAAPRKKQAGKKKAEPASAKKKKAPAASGGGGAAAKSSPLKAKNGDTSFMLADEDQAVFTNLDQAKKQGGKKAIEDIYQKKSQLEHILLRPDTYVGSVEYTESAPMWVYDMETEKIVQRDIRYVPGLYKIFDEILVNAADNKQRDPKMNLIKIDINKAANTISVMNNGKGIPVAFHKDEKMYVPELIFGTLLTSSNYNDDERKVTGGRNGYGAKLCNIFSLEFTVETSSREYKKSFRQTWKNNMTKDAEAVISEPKDSDYTKITFKPDLKKFKMSELDDDIIALMCRRAFDVAGTSRGVKVYLNGKLIPVQGFKQYVELYTSQLTDDQDEPVKMVFEEANNRWEVALCVSEKGFQQVSFVNSIATTKGGRHVDYVADQLVSKLIDIIKKKAGKTTVNVKPFQVKNHMWVFVNSLIENPTFDSQTKETMTLQHKSFGSTCSISDKFAKGAMNCGVVEAVLSWVKFKQMEQMDKKCSAKKTSKIKGIPKLEDANDAGTKNSMNCTLILTEGDSAKTLAVSGLGVIGRDRYGVFPLRGKFINVRDATSKQIGDNAEVNALLKILGLQFKLKYTDPDQLKTLRYGKVMIMADQDQDGSHIKGLVINFFHHNWPSLIQQNFVEEFITPIVKVTKGREELSFFSIPEYNEWREATNNWKAWKIKYYKGLGTSTSKEAKEYFSDMTRHRIRFRYAGDTDDKSVELAFSKKCVEQRKDWLTKWMEEKKARRERGLGEEYLYGKDTRVVSYTDFINKELVLFSNMDNERSIPCLVDGFKPGQRKVLFACFKRADKKEVKVAQLAGAVAELSAYHHGEQSLMATIVNMAQDYVGSNNINLLLPIGQFGTRLQGGKDSASPRYIFTQLSPVTRTLFCQHDDDVLRFLFEENQRIEPEWYCPIIPMVLVNGAAGIGTGWSTNVPNYNPRDIVANIRRLIRDEEQQPIMPWFKNFRGQIEKVDGSRYVCSGEISILDDDTIEITELPIKTWTQAYKETVLEELMGGGGSDDKKKEKQQPIVADYKEYHTDQTVRFVVKLVPGKLRSLLADGLHKVFKLQTVISTNSMVLFDSVGCLRRFESAEDICKEFFEVRKRKYVERKAFRVGMLRAQSDRLKNQARFILAKINKEIILEDKRKTAIFEQLVEKGFDPDPVKKWNDAVKKKILEETGEMEPDENEDNNGESSSDEQEEDAPTNGPKMSDYDYLLTMTFIRVSREEKDKLLKESEEKLSELRTLEAKTWSDLWEEDLTAFLAALQKKEDKDKAELDEIIKNTTKKLQKEAASGGGRKKAVGLNADALPSKDGDRVVPTVDRAKYEKEALKEKKPKEPKPPKEPKVPKAAKKSPVEDKKQTKLNFSKVEKPAKGSDDDEDDDDDDVEMLDENDEPIVPKERPKRERKAAPVVRDETSDEDDDIVIEDDDDSDEYKDDEDSPRPKKKAPATKGAKKTENSNDSTDVKKKPPAPKQKQTKRKNDGSDSDDSFKPVKKNRAVYSDLEESD